MDASFAGLSLLEASAASRSSLIKGFLETERFFQLCHYFGQDCPHLGAASQVAEEATAEARQKLLEAEATIASLRAELDAAGAQREAAAAQQRTIDGLLESVYTCTRDVSRLFGARVPPGDDEPDVAVARLRWMADVNISLVEKITEHFCDIAQASAELAFTCLRKVSCDPMGRFEAKGFIAPGKSKIEDSRPFVCDDVHAFLRSVWDKRGMKYVQGLWRSRTPKRAAADVSAGGSSGQGFPAQV